MNEDTPLLHVHVNPASTSAKRSLERRTGAANAGEGSYRHREVWEEDLDDSCLKKASLGSAPGR